jgi:hypothetical protein
MMVDSEPILKPAVTTTEQGILKTLIYFDIFNYPLTVEELLKFHPSPIANEIEFRDVLQEMATRGWLYRHNQFFSLQESAASVERRVKGNKLAEEKLPIAKKYCRIIASFPFVRAILLSGSISKNYMDANSDVDYFIVTEPGRLWLTRALLAAFKRVFLLNSRKFFCINYFVDARSLEIEEKNIYTAFEIATLIPVYGKEVCEKFMGRNAWMKNHFPNLAGQTFEIAAESGSAFKSVFEKMFSGKTGEWLDNFFMKLARSRWKKKYGTIMSEADFEIAFKSRKNVSKSHPQFFQKRILEFFDKKVRAFETQHQLKIPA